MIFVTVGAQMPFDRLIRTTDEWARTNARDDFFAQIGRTELRPSHVQWSTFLHPSAYRDFVTRATVIVAHAGMGSIITALELGKPILVMPRRGHLKETRNDHQVDTARKFLARGGINVAFNEEELWASLSKLNLLQATAPQKIAPVASLDLIQTIRSFILLGQVSANDTANDCIKLVAKPESLLGRQDNGHQANPVPAHSS